MSVSATVFNYVKGKVEIALNAVITVFENKGDKTYEWGEKGCFPDKAYALIADSITARRAINVTATFLTADGFTAPDPLAKPDPKSPDRIKTMGDRMVNPKQTANQLLAQSAKFEAAMESHVWIVRFDLLTLEPSSAFCTPVDKVEKKLNGNFYVNPRRKGQDKYNKFDRVEYPAFERIDTKNGNAKINLRAKIDEQVKKYGSQIGFILYTYTPDIGEGEHYANPAWYAASYDLATEAELGRMEYKQSRKGLNISAIIRTPPIDKTKTMLPGDPEESDKWTGPSADEEWKREIRKFTGEEGEKSSSIMHIVNELPDNPIEVTPFNPLANAADLTLKRLGIAKNIARACGVPTVLLSLFDAGGIGDTKKIFDELSLYNDSLKTGKARLRSPFDQVWPGEDWTISTLNPITFIPAEVLAKMTNEELRALADLAPLPEPKAGDINSVRQALSTLSPLVATKILDSMTINQKLSLVNLPGIPGGDQLVPASNPNPAP